MSPGGTKRLTSNKQLSKWILMLYFISCLKNIEKLWGKLKLSVRDWSTVTLPSYSTIYAHMYIYTRGLQKVRGKHLYLLSLWTNLVFITAACLSSNCLDPHWTGTVICIKQRCVSSLCASPLSSWQFPTLDPHKTHTRCVTCI